MDAMFTSTGLELQIGGGIQLPFAAPYFYWRNGQRVLKANNDYTYFGGWESNGEKFEDFLAETGIDFPGLKRVEWAGKEGDYTAYGTRVLHVAPIGQRERWDFDDENGEKKGKGHSVLQILCYAASYDAEKQSLAPVGPVVLSAKSLSGKYVKDALAKFASATAQARRENSTKGATIEWNAFYASVGTFGSEANFKEVGKKIKNFVNPCAVKLPDPVDKDFLVKRFVGQTIIAVMQDLKEQAKEWLAAWPKTQKPGAGVAAEPEPEQPPDNPPDDYPF